MQKSRPERRLGSGAAMLRINVETDQAYALIAS